MGNNPSTSRDVTQENQISLLQFRLMGIVGRGAFGKVRIVEHVMTKKQYALKYIPKNQIIKADSAKNIIRERRILEKIRHPFICNLRYSFQDADYLYIVVDLMTGGDLRFHLSRRTFSESAIRFWIAELACALNYIHDRDIVHRDVKPENILLDADGHVCLADFNVAFHIRRNNKPDSPRVSMDNATQSTTNLLHGRSGTMTYLPPEVYTGEGYGTACDWWSLGVVLYECIYSRRPFLATPEDELIAQIKQASPKYYLTSPPVSYEAEHATRSLLSPNPSTRLGATGMSRFFEEHFFSMYTLEELEAKRYGPIFVPSKAQMNFDAAYELEELLFEDTPLEVRGGHNKKRGFPKLDASAEQLREAEMHKAFENLFEVFDYTAVKVTNKTTITPREYLVPHNRSQPQSRSRTPVATEKSTPAVLNSRSQQKQSALVGQISNDSSSASISSTSDSDHETPASSPASSTLDDAAATGIQELKHIVSLNTSPIPQYYEYKHSLSLPQLSSTTRQRDNCRNISYPQSRLVNQAAPNKHHESRKLLRSERDQSPSVFENGVLGKEGARTIVRS
ncbi:kinase-like domain-containing protein [Lipomyces arxii]|uniref:kinase-like domain-containing protein n=1 Tax=Lipomyces arxii TaxID=56418 RepID=UPI0034CE01E8